MGTPERVSYLPEAGSAASEAVEALAVNVTHALTHIVALTIGLIAATLTCVTQWDTSTTDGWHVVLPLGSLIFPGSLTYFVLLSPVHASVRRLVSPCCRNW